MPKPSVFLEVRVHDTARMPALCGLCAGYESGEWRAGQFAAHLIDWLPEFVLTKAEQSEVGPHNMMSFVREAARRVYTTDKYQKRGESGELLLHLVLRQIYDSVPAIAKLYHKSANNDTVKGFDAVHVIANGEEWELWLGEVKFYSSIRPAISSVIEELSQHSARDYLRDEFALIRSKLDIAEGLNERLKRFLEPNTSLDEVFKRLVFPVLLTYDSSTVSDHMKATEEFKAALTKELWKQYEVFEQKASSLDLQIHLFLIPLGSKTRLNEEFDKRLKGLQI